MKTSSLILMTLLAAQLALAGGLFFNTVNQRAVRPQGSMLELDANTVTQLSIKSEDNAVMLEKKQDKWLISSSGLPAEQSRVEKAIKSLGDMQLGWSVATSDSSHQQLEVADNKYQRRVNISTDGNGSIPDIFLGTSPGFKRSHVRKDGTDEVYSAAINTYDLPAKPLDWLDKTLLQISDVTQLVVKDDVLELKEDQWIHDGGNAVDQEKAAALVQAFDDLRVIDTVKPDSDNLDFQTVTLKSGDNEHQYQFGTVDDDYLVARTDIDQIFKISKSSYDKIIAVDLYLPEEKPATTDEEPNEAGLEGPASEDSPEELPQPTSADKQTTDSN